MKNWFTKKIDEFRLGFQYVLKNYLLEIIVSLLFALSYIITNIFFNTWDKEYIGDFYYSFPICFGIIYSINLLTKSSKYRFLYFISFLIIPLVYTLEIEINERMFIGIITTILLIYIAKKRKENTYFVSTILQTLLNIGISIILASICIGLLFSILESIRYIFELDFERKNYEIIFFSFSYLIVFPILFLIFDIKGERKILGEKFDTILIKYILTPAFYIFGIILYIYFAKILIQFSLPKGVVSATAIGFLTLGLIIKTATDSYTKPFQKWFFPYFSLYSIPALIMLWIATLVRILEYGFTMPRVYLLLSVIAITLWLIGLLFKQTKKYYSLTILTIIIFNLFTFIPYIDAKSIEKYSQESRPKTQEEILEEENKMYYLHNPVISYNISDYKELISLEYNNEENAWRYTTTDNQIKIYNSKGDIVFKESKEKIIEQQIKKLGISKEAFRKTINKEKLVNKYADKFFIIETPEMKIIFSNINFKHNLKDEISIYISFVLIK